MAERRPAGRLAVRLAAAFVVVAVSAVAVLAVLIVVTAAEETGDLDDAQHRDAARAAAYAAARAYESAGGWPGADLGAAGAVAASAQARLVVADAAGRVVAAPPEGLAEMMAEMHGIAVVDTPRGHPVLRPVVVDGRTVGSVTLTFPVGTSAAERVRDALWRTAVAGTALGAALAVAVAVFVATRLTRPLEALTDAAARLAAGDRSARAGPGGPGELGVLAATFDDMAARLEAEDGLRRRLVADVAHELRTPLTILQGETEALLDGVAAPDGAAIASLHDEVTRLVRLVADLETLAAADAARLSLRHGPVDLARVASRAVAAVRPAAADAGLTLEEELAPAPASGDPDRLHQITLNLLSNAVKFTPPGGSVTVTTEAGDSGARLVVTDTGPGVGDDGDRVFDRFWQGRAGREAGGSGIGLAVARELAVAHRGTLTASDAPGGGARFTLSLPGR